MRKISAMPERLRLVRIFLTLYRRRLLYEASVITSKLTSKAQTTIPQAVRNALRLREGDEIAYRIEEDRVVLTRVPPRGESPRDDPFATFSEWDSEADRAAYADL